MIQRFMLDQMIKYREIYYMQTFYSFIYKSIIWIFVLYIYDIFFIGFIRRYKECQQIMIYFSKNILFYKNQDHVTLFDICKY